MAKSRDSYIRFFFADWLVNLKIQACSFAAQGLWINLLCIMAKDGRPYGHLSFDARTPLSAEKLAFVTRKRVTDIAPLLRELAYANVFSTTEGGIIFSRRLVRDMDLRRIRSSCGKKGGNPLLLKVPVQAKRGSEYGYGSSSFAGNK